MKLKESTNTMRSTSEPVINSSGNTGKGKIRIAVFGRSQVGKSALSVRYLTKRFLGEYLANTDFFYNQTLAIPNGTPLDIEIVDISTQENSPLQAPTKWDGIILVYSITDRSSFEFATEALNKISTAIQNATNESPTSSPPSTPPAASLPSVILLANKIDLEHLRAVEKIEGISLAMEFGCHFFELSVAENSPQVHQSFSIIINNHYNQTANNKPKRRFSVSKILFKFGKLGIVHTSSSNNKSDELNTFDITNCRNSFKNKVSELHSIKKTICS